MPLNIKEIPGLTEQLNELALRDPSIQLDSVMIQNSIFVKYIEGQSDISMALCNKLKPESFILAARILAHSTSLKILSIEDNNLGKHAILVTQALAKSTSLKSLNIAINNLGKHAILVAQALAKSTSLRSLNIEDNNLGKHAILVAQALAKSTSLCKLRLDLNNIEDIHLKKIASIAFEQHSALCTICIGGSMEFNPAIKLEIEQIVSDRNYLASRSLAAALQPEEGVCGIPVKNLTELVGEYVEEVKIVFEF